jgi:hypothetical protein|nr:MAG TPA: hypothetical protein [Bacteriophage sp.]
MNNEVKVSLTVVLPGRTMVSQQVAENKPLESYDTIVVELWDKEVQKRERMFVKVRKSIPAKQSINLSVDAYKYMVSDEAPYFIKSKVWKAMNIKNRLEAHLQKICEQLNGISYTYEVLN